MANFKPLMALAALTGALLVAPAAGAADTARGPSDWSMWQYGTSGSRFNAAERRIRPTNVSRLQLSWAWAALDGDEMHSQPAVVGDSLYVGGQDGRFYALDAKTGRQRWVYDTRPVAGPTPPRPPNPDELWDIDQNPLRNGPTVEGDAVYFGDTRGNVYALDRRTGRHRWDTKIHDHRFAVVTSSPLYYEGKLYVGTSGNEPIRTLDENFWCCTFRGKVVALGRGQRDALRQLRLHVRRRTWRPRPPGIQPRGMTTKEGRVGRDWLSLDPWWRRPGAWWA